MPQLKARATAEMQGPEFTGSEQEMPNPQTGQRGPRQRLLNRKPEVSQISFVVFTI